MLFKYRALDTDGHERQGTVEALSMDVAVSTLQRRSLVPIPDMVFYKDQLEEINEITARIAALTQAVQVRGFPLGLIRAVNTGKVVNPYDLDQEQGWNHVDFVTDALLSEGNSGSPVLALRR